MTHARIQRIFVAVVANLGLAIAAQGEMVINFDNLAVGTEVTTQYEGVTFSVQPQPCLPDNTAFMEIANPLGGTSSGTRALKIQQNSCGPGFSPEFLRMVFSEAHQEISFTLGDYAGTFEIRAFSTVSGAAGAIPIPNVVIEGVGSVGCFRLVRVRSASANIRRIEIEEAASQFEVIDDLTLDCVDATAPTAAITVPATLGCTCNSVSITGTASDADGAFGSYQLHRRAPGAAAWTLIRTSTTPVVAGELAVWTTSAAAGYYYLRLTVTNACGLQGVDTALVYLDKQAPTVAIRSPLGGEILGGTVCLEGTVLDQCGGAVAVERQVACAGGFAPITSVNAPWTTNDPFASWNTAGGGVADGMYCIRTTATDDCMNATVVTRTVTIDNTRPVALITAPVNCSFESGIISIRGTASDANIDHWYLEFVGGDAHEWTPIANGASNVVNGVLANWNTVGLRVPCAYTIRLRVIDRSIHDCNGSSRGYDEYAVSINLGSPCDVNQDGSANNFDVDAFVTCLLGG